MSLKFRISIIIFISTITIIANYYKDNNKNNQIYNNVIENEISYNNTILNNDIKINNTITNDIIIQNDNVIEEENNKIDNLEWEDYYTTTAVNLREGPGLNKKIIEVLLINTKIKVLIKDNEEWAQVKKEEKIYYINKKYISKEKTEIKVSSVTTRGSSSITNRVNSNNVLTKSKGVNYFNGHKETWYSQKVLPGGGLNIPGRHVAADGTIRDKDNYICVASSDYPKGTIVETSLGTGKVYDTGCASGVIDIYTNWD